MDIDAEKIRRALAETGESPVALARRAGISASHLANAMAGRRGLSPRTLDRLAKVLGTRPGALCHGDDGDNRRPIPGTAPALGKPIVLDGDSVRYWRRHFHMSVAELAQSAGVTPSWVSSVERSSKTELSPGSDHAHRLAGALAVPVTALDATRPDRPPG
jgi:transcriptional regulator with XRE-family HTH domain